MQKNTSFHPLCACFVCQCVTVTLSVLDRCRLACFLTAKAVGSFLDQISGNYYQQRNEYTFAAAARLSCACAHTHLCALPHAVRGSSPAGNAGALMRTCLLDVLVCVPAMLSDIHAHF